MSNIEASHMRTVFRQEIVVTAFLGIGLTMMLGSMPQLIVLKIFHAGDWIATLVNSYAYVTNLCVIFFIGWLSGIGKGRLFVTLGMVSSVLICLIPLIPISDAVHADGLLMQPRSEMPLFIFLTVVFFAVLAHHLAENIRLTLWRLNYPDHFRGRVTSIFSAITLLIAVVLVPKASRMIESGAVDFRIVYLICGLSMLAAYVIAAKTISPPRLTISGANTEAAPKRMHVNLIESCRIVANDRPYVCYQVLQMIHGASNLIVIIPLAVLLDHTFSGRLGLSDLAMITVATPAALNLASVVIWGYFADSMHLLRLRVFSALSFAIASYVLFIGLFRQDLLLIYIAAGIRGIGQGSGSILWRLGHTVFASPENDYRYFAVHQSLTGIRGLLSGFIGLSLFNFMGPWIALLAAVGNTVTIPGYYFLYKEFVKLQRRSY